MRSRASARGCRRSPSRCLTLGGTRSTSRGRSPLLEGVSNGTQVYFTHSFAAPVTADCVAATTHGATFAAAVQRDNVWGVQFHPEKSGAGLRILQNFTRTIQER